MQLLYLGIQLSCAARVKLVSGAVRTRCSNPHSSSMKNKLSLCIVAATLWMATSVFGQTSLIAPNATWRYLDTGADQGAAWKNSGFNDATWKTGTGEFGYGDGDETTILSFG